MKQNWRLITKQSSLVNSKISESDKATAHRVYFSYVLFVNKELIY